MKAKTALPHISVYVDESGDLGLSLQSSKFFSVGYAFVASCHIETENKAIGQTLRGINRKRKNRKRKMSEFKFSSDSKDTKNKFLRRIRDMNVGLGTICISKDSVKKELRRDPAGLYRHVIGDTVITNLMCDHFAGRDPDNSIRLIIDRSLSESGRKKFNRYCEDRALFCSLKQDRRMRCTISISHEDSKAARMLQVADYVAGAVQRKFDGGDSQFYDLIRHKIKYRKKWDENNRISW